jgi:regulator of sigma E protease
MSSVLIAVVSMLVVLGIMIVVHEFGHYAVAKLCGVRVEVFSVGFGKRLLGFTRGDTDYRISALPFGGYVRMTGENPMEAKSNDPAAFSNHPRWQRFLIAVAGPAMNILLAIALLAGLYMSTHRYMTFLRAPSEIGYIVPGSPADKAGLKPGDVLIRVDDESNPIWEDTLSRMSVAGKDGLDLGVRRGAEVLSIKLPFSLDATDPKEMVFDGIVPAHQSTVGSVVAGKPAEKAGIKAGDVIDSVNGTPVYSTQQFQKLLRETSGAPLTFKVLRGGSPVAITVTPVRDDASPEHRFMVGFYYGPESAEERLGFTAAVTESAKENFGYSALIIDLLQKLVERKVSLKAVNGPVGIAAASGEAVKSGPHDVIALMSMISLNLGVMNLLPFPILDGGLILLLIIEGLARRDINQQVKERIYQTAFVFLVMFAVLVMYNDISKLPGVGKFLP